MPKQYLLIFALLFIGSITTNAQRSETGFNLDAYKSQPGLLAEVNNDILTVLWDGDTNQEIRLQFVVDNAAPVIYQMAIRNKNEDWQIVAENISPEFRVVSGLRRVTQQQTEPLEEMGIPITEEKLNEIKWDAFWDAPLYLSQEPPRSHASSIPAAEPFLNHPGMPRQPDEVTRATAKYNITSCTVRTNGARLEIVFDGVEAGIFSGYLQYDVYKGSNLIRQMLVAKTDHPSAAFKYDAGLAGLPIQSESKMVWRDMANNWQHYEFGGPADKIPAIIKSNNRLMTAELQHGAIAAFPPPHSFYWARESEQNLGYGWYRKDDNNTFSFGIRQAEREEDPEYYHNFALYNARPGTWQRMPIFFCINPESGKSATKQALAFTHGDHFKPLPGYKVMGHHYHVGLVKRLKKTGGLDQPLNDMSSMRAVGIDIFSIIDGVRGPGRHDKGELFLKDLEEYYEAARRQSDKNFLVMPNDENSTGGRPPFMGGHYDIIVPGPVYWRPQRLPDEPLYFEHEKYGRVYNVGTPEDMMKMAEKENVLLSMPHPDTKRSTGYPEAIVDEPHFQHQNYFSLGYRWGMGIDASEKRLGEYRFLRVWNETNNRLAAKGYPPKFTLAISEARSDKGERGKPPWDDTYGMAPVNYLKLDSIPPVDDMSSITDALQAGEYFITTGEVLIPHYEIKGSGTSMTIVAEVEWTFPLEFVEVVWGDGITTDRQVISTSDLAAFGKKRFEIPFDAIGKKWIRFAAWDVAMNGALVQPVGL